MKVQNDASPFFNLVNAIKISACGEVAEWSKAAALGAALFGGVGSNPILVSLNILCEFCTMTTTRQSQLASVRKTFSQPI